MNGRRWLLVLAAFALYGLSFPCREAWEQNCLVASVVLLCVLLLVGPTKTS